MSTRVTKNISLSPELDEFIAAHVKSGRYQSASDVVRDALRLLEDRELARQAAIRDLRQKIVIGLDQIRNGEVRDGETTFREIKQLAHKRRGGAT